MISKRPTIEIEMFFQMSNQNSRHNRNQIASGQRTNNGPRSQVRGEIALRLKHKSKLECQWQIHRLYKWLNQNQNLIKPSQLYSGASLSTPSKSQTANRHRQRELAVAVNSEIEIARKRKRERETNHRRGKRVERRRQRSG